MTYSVGHDDCFGRLSVQGRTVFLLLSVRPGFRVQRNRCRRRRTSKRILIVANVRPHPGSGTAGLSGIGSGVTPGFSAT